MTIYDHMFDVTFTVLSDRQAEDITAEELIFALEERLNYLKLHPLEVLEAVGIVDTSEII